MEKNVEKKKGYEAPSFRKVHLEVKTSVLGVCSLSQPVSPEIGSCQTINPCFESG